MKRRSGSIFSLILLFATLGATAQGQVIYASGQNNGDPTHATGNYLYAIDPFTGMATPVSPVIVGSTPAGLAGLRDGRLFGFRNGQLVEVNPLAGTWTSVGGASGVSATSLDVLGDGRGYLLPFNAGNDTQQLHQIDLNTGAVTPIGGATAVGEAVEAAGGLSPGSANPFVISLGSIGETLYGVDLETNSLLAMNPDTGVVSVVGALGAADSAEGGAYSGYSALTGVDLNQDGTFDALYGNANFFDPDGPGGEPSQRFGGIVRYDLNDGTWSLVGSNPGLIFFGMGSSPANVPEPGSVALLLGVSVSSALALRRKK